MLPCDAHLNTVGVGLLGVEPAPDFGSGRMTESAQTVKRQTASGKKAVPTHEADLELQPRLTQGMSGSTLPVQRLRG